ncbi:MULTISPECIES: hypothetical protein [unclassified Bradyrhizobium]|uniref:hypothetical protein n=1 Tax=unclassified Bradyrhizobium TaxID=2631580 RepID=UPI0012EC9CF8|nr:MULTISPECIES: hypothetical protein [unclassified Bradyrhizobium]QIG91121.1 hypothetical protein G6P99_00395 [Bradyrhizobium sp. 6(2017)]
MLLAEIGQSANQSRPLTSGQVAIFWSHQDKLPVACPRSGSGSNSYPELPLIFEGAQIKAQFPRHQLRGHRARDEHNKAAGHHENAANPAAEHRGKGDYAKG